MGALAHAGKWLAVAGWHHPIWGGVILAVVYLGVRYATASSRMLDGGTVVRTDWGIVPALIGAVAIVLYYTRDDHGPAKLAAREAHPRVTHTTVVEHVTKSSPLLSGTDIVLIVLVVAVTVLVAWLNRRRKGGR